MPTDKTERDDLKAEQALFETIAPKYPMLLNKREDGRYADSLAFSHFQIFREGLRLAGWQAHAESVAPQRPQTLEEVDEYYKRAFRKLQEDAAQFARGEKIREIAQRCGEINVLLPIIEVRNSEHGLFIIVGGGKAESLSGAARACTQVPSLENAIEEAAEELANQTHGVKSLIARIIRASLQKHGAMGQSEMR